MYILYIENMKPRATKLVRAAPNCPLWCNESCWIVPGTVED